MKHLPLAQLSDVQELAPVYCVFRDFGKIGIEGLCYPEHTRSKVASLYHSGEWENVTKILEINEAEGTCRDILADIKTEGEQ